MQTFKWIMDQLPDELVENVLSISDHRTAVSYALTSQANVKKFAAYAESKTCRFETGARYVSTDTALGGHIRCAYAVKSIRKGKKSRGHGFLTIRGSSRRIKIRMNDRGVEWVRLGPDYKYTSLHATDNKINLKQIARHNKNLSGYR